MTKQVGDKAENDAERYLQQQGLSLIERNFRTKMGEIDLIMYDKDSLVFVEVRYRKNAAFGGAAASVDGRKQRKLINTAHYYLMCHAQYATVACRFDVILLDAENHVDWIKNAFEEH